DRQAHRLAADLEDRTPKNRDRLELARSLAAVCKVSPSEAAAKRLAAALAGETIPAIRESVVASLVTVCKALPPAGAATYLILGANRLAADLPKESLAWRDLVELCKAFPPEQAAAYLLVALAHQPALRAQLMSPLSAVAARSSLLETVEILKHPLCFGEARQ